MADGLPLARVLVVDDSRELAGALRVALVDAGYEVRTADNGLSALARAAAWPPDVILLDLVMPVMNGWDFVERYRRRPGPHAPIVVMTAFAPGGRQSENLLAEVTAVDVLPKPMDFAEAIAVVGRYAQARLSGGSPESRAITPAPLAPHAARTGP